jgi:outer membrane protein TolC
LDSKDELLRAYLGILPGATLSAVYSNPSRFESSYNTSFSIGRSIALNEPTYFDIRGSRLNRQIVDLDHENLRKSFALEILRSYISIIRQERNIRIENESFNSQKRLHEQTRIQFNQGTRTIHDLQRTQLDTLSTYINLNTLNHALAKSREDLFFMIGLEDRGYPLENFEFIIHETTSNEGQARNLNVKVSELNFENNRLHMTQRYLSLFPSIYARFDWSTGHSSRHLDNELVSFQNYRSSSMFSVGMSYPLFNQFEQGLNYRIARRRFALTKVELEDLKENTSREIAQQIREIERLRQTYQLQQQRHELARLNLQMAEEKFMLGFLNKIELDDARIVYLNAESGLANDFYNLILQQEELNLLQSNKILGIW